MNKKKILFINYSLHSGGIEKSLVTLLSVFDYSKYDVDLQLFVHEGLFLENVPDNVNLLPPLLPREYKFNIRQAFFALLKKGMIKTAFCRLFVTLSSQNGSLGDRLKRVYNIEKHMLNKNRIKYDTAVAFMEGQPLYYLVDFINADKKIGFIHGDYKSMGLNKDFEEPYIKKLDALCTVSEACKASLDDVFPESAYKHHVIYNIISEKALKSLAEKEHGFDDNYSGKRILTIARLSHQKGLDIGINAVSLIKNLDFKWYIIGIGPLENELKQLINTLGLNDKVVFLGEKANPYPYLNECDIYFQPSRFEGKAIAVDEACVLLKPILLGNYSTACDQIENGLEGIICELTPEALAENLKALLVSDDLSNKYSDQLKNKSVTNEEEIQKLYNLI